VVYDREEDGEGIVCVGLFFIGAIGVVGAEGQVKRGRQVRIICGWA